MKESMITTIDNPFSPISQFDKWYQYDMDQGYDTCGYLARIATYSTSFSHKEQEDEIERAIDEMVRLNINGLYKKVYEEVEPPK